MPERNLERLPLIPWGRRNQVLLGLLVLCVLANLILMVLVTFNLVGGS